MVIKAASHRKKNKQQLSQDEIIERLNLFIEKAEHLKTSSLIAATTIKQDSSFDKAVTPQLHAVRVNWDYIDAFLLTLRLFLRDNDVISINNIAGIISELEVSQGPKDTFNKQRENLNKYLDRKCQWSIQGDRPTNNEALETILYGFHGHLDLEKYRRYKRWTKGRFGIPLVYTVFISILQDFLKRLLVLSFNCRLMVEELSAEPENTKEDR